METGDHVRLNIELHSKEAHHQSIDKIGDRKSFHYEAEGTEEHGVPRREEEADGSLTVSEDTIIKGTRLLRTDRGELRTCKNVGVKDTASGKASNDSTSDLALG